MWKVPVLKGSSIATLLAISSRDRAVLEETEARREEGEGERNTDRGGNARRVRLRLGSIETGSGPGSRGEGWFLDSSGGGAGDDVR